MASSVSVHNGNIRHIFFCRVVMALCCRLHGTGCDGKLGLISYSMSPNFIHRLDISFKRTLPRRWCLVQSPSRKVLFLSNMEELYMSKYLKNKKRSEGKKRLEVVVFLKGENESPYFTWQPIYVELKVNIVRMSKQKRNGRNYLFLTGVFLSRTKRYTIQFVFSAAVDVQCCRDSHC